MPPLPPFPLALFLAALAFSVSHAEIEEEWPVEISITTPGDQVTIQRPVGVVAGFGTTIYVATTAGQLFLTDVKTGQGQLLNSGGDNQRFGGLCLDSRGPGTLYATGRDSGLLFAFNRRGELLQKYQIEDAGNDVFLSGCIQTQYQLIIIDSLNPRLFYLPLADTGPSRGYPPPPAPFEHQGYEIFFEGDWNQTGSGFNAYGVEWTQKFKRIAYVMNSATGELYICTVTNNEILGEMRKVRIQGKMKTFPGALQILFDSSNENVLYLSMPNLNAIAVLEVSGRSPGQAKYIRMITSPLIDGVVAISEYGDFIYPVNGKLTAGPSASEFTLLKLSRHRQLLDSGDPDQDFSTILDDVDQPTPAVVMESAEVEDVMRSPPSAVGTSAPVAIGTTPPPTTSDSSAPSASDGATSGAPTASSPEATSSNDEQSSPTATPSAAPDASASPVPAADTPSNEGDGPSSVFAVPPTDEDTGSSCFPGTATVMRENGGLVSMYDLRIGDRVLVGVDETGQARFSDVFLFSHQDRQVQSIFIRISTSNGRALELSPGHYLYVNEKLATAATVEVGDVLSHAEERSIQVVRTEEVQRYGLFNPQTVDGDIFVNGFRTSTYTSSIEPVVANALLAPLRAVHFCGTGFSRRITSLLAQGGKGIERFLPSGLRLYA